MQTVKLTAIIAGLALLFAACSETESIDESLALAEKSMEIEAAQSDSCSYVGVLTQTEIDGLKLMREEEKLARDVYLSLYETYGNIIFQNIAKSEAAHTNAILRLLDGYGIDDPALESEGEFSNPDLAALYSALITQDSSSLVAALKVGATIEDLDIYDLTELLAENENEDVERVYTNLLKGSENHMRAFMRTLSSLGETYTPVYISVEEFEAILNSENTSGKNGKGKGKGNSNSNQGNNGSGTCDGTGPNS
jgi:hypothetical protein